MPFDITRSTEGRRIDWFLVILLLIENWLGKKLEFFYI